MTGVQTCALPIPPTGEAICRTPKNFRTFSKQASTPLDYSLETLDPQTHAATSSWIIHGASQLAPATTSAPSAPRPTSPFARLRLSRPTPFPTISTHRPLLPRPSTMPPSTRRRRHRRCGLLRGRTRTISSTRKVPTRGCAWGRRLRSPARPLPTRQCWAGLPWRESGCSG